MLATKKKPAARGFGKPPPPADQQRINERRELHPGAFELYKSIGPSAMAKQMALHLGRPYEQNTHKSWVYNYFMGKPGKETKDYVEAYLTAWKAGTLQNQPSAPTPRSPAPVPKPPLGGAGGVKLSVTGVTPRSDEDFATLLRDFNPRHIHPNGEPDYTAVVTMHAGDVGALRAAARRLEVMIVVEPKGELVIKEMFPPPPAPAAPMALDSESSSSSPPPPAVPPKRKKKAVNYALPSDSDDAPAAKGGDSDSDGFKDEEEESSSDDEEEET